MGLRCFPGCAANVSFAYISPALDGVPCRLKCSLVCITAGDQVCEALRLVILQLTRGRRAEFFFARAMSEGEDRSGPNRRARWSPEAPNDAERMACPWQAREGGVDDKGRTTFGWPGREATCRFSHPFRFPGSGRDRARRARPRAIPWRFRRGSGRRERGPSWAGECDLSGEHRSPQKPHLPDPHSTRSEKKPAGTSPQVQRRESIRLPSL